jgi:DNA polymerase, archaea type
LRFDALKRCQLDIETDSDGVHFSNPYKDRILAIGMKMGEKEALLCLEADTAAAEQLMLEQFVETLQAWDPDVIEGHNIFAFDLNYLKIRSQKRKVPCAWGRIRAVADFRKSRLKVAERWVDFQRCDIPGRTVFDTYLMVQLYDVTTRDLPGYGLKTVAKYFGVTRKLDHERTYIEGSKIHLQFREDRASFLEYLRDDLLETAGIAAILLPTYFEQCKSFPLLLQEACLRGTSNKVDCCFLNATSMPAMPYRWQQRALRGLKVATPTVLRKGSTGMCCTMTWRRFIPACC